MLQHAMGDWIINKTFHFPKVSLPVAGLSKYTSKLIPSATCLALPTTITLVDPSKK